MGKIITQAMPSKKRVAAYVRVSLETERLTHSLAAQTEYFSELIAANDDWESAGIYSDSFISGTDITRRTALRRLIADCELGRVDVVLCKSISRFARNTVDLLNTVRRLAELGVEVRFEKENISSLSGDGELLLTILASFAQEESRSISENVKWGIRKRFRLGTAKVRNKAVYGYRLENGRYIIQEDEATIVRLVFGMYIDGASLRDITARLHALGAKTLRGCDFSHSVINYMLRNELYTGTVVFQKFYTTNFITHAKTENRGELPRYRLCGSHEAIISEETFAAAQEEMLRRAPDRPVYCFSGKLICEDCKKPFTRRTNGGKYACWHCRICSSVKLKENDLRAVFGMSDDEFSETVSSVTVRRGGRLEIHYTDGRQEQCICE